MTEFQQIVINLVNEGKTVSEIAKQLGRNTSLVSSIVKRFNLTSKKAYENTVKDDFFDKIDSEEKAYLLGFFYSRWMYKQNNRQKQRKIWYKSVRR